jgi:PEP-CTERM motif
MEGTSFLIALLAWSEGEVSMAGQICAMRSRYRRARGLFLTAATLITTGMLGTGVAQANVYSFQWDRPPGFDGSAGPIFANGEAGVITSVTSEYDSDSQTLSFVAAFEPEPGTGQLPVGFFLVINNGPLPIGVDGEYAILYFDAITDTTPILTAYAYNGENGADSFFDGAAVPGNQAPDPILSSLNDPSWVNSASSVNTPGGRVVSFSINTSAINGHSPSYGTDAAWKGIGFDDTLGIWFHPYSQLNPAYGTDGFLLPDPSGISWLQWGQYPDLGEQFHGWYDATNLSTDVNIPEPATLGLIGLGAAALLGRDRARRR